MKNVNKLSDKLVKISDSFTVNRCDNGFVFETNGRNANEEYVSIKLICADFDSLVMLVHEASQLELDS